MSLKGLSRRQSRDEALPPESQPGQYKVHMHYDATSNQHGHDGYHGYM